MSLQRLRHKGAVLHGGVQDDDRGPLVPVGNVAADTPVSGLMQGLIGRDKLCAHSVLMPMRGAASWHFSVQITEKMGIVLARRHLFLPDVSFRTNYLWSTLLKGEGMPIVCAVKPVRQGIRACVHMKEASADRLEVGSTWTHSRGTWTRTHGPDLHDS